MDAFWRAAAAGLVFVSLSGVALRIDRWMYENRVDYSDVFLRAAFVVVCLLTLGFYYFLKSFWHEGSESKKEKDSLNRPTNKGMAPRKITELTAADCWALVHGFKEEGAKRWGHARPMGTTFGLAVKELVCRGYFRFDPEVVKKGKFKGPQLWETDLRVRISGALYPVLRKLRKGAKEFGGSFPLDAALKMWPPHYYENAILRRLEKQGFVQQSPFKRFGVFESVRPQLTPAGQVARDDLHSLLLETKNGIRDNAINDPEVAMRALESAGPSVLLLLPELLPELMVLADQNTQGMDVKPGSLNILGSTDALKPLEKLFAGLTLDSLPTLRKEVGNSDWTYFGDSDWDI